MPQSLSKIWLHVVFSTKERKRYFQNEQFRTEMFRMLSHEVTTFDCVSAGVGGYVDHVHLLIGLTYRNRRGFGQALENSNFKMGQVSGSWSWYVSMASWLRSFLG